jgi:predicted permease
MRSAWRSLARLDRFEAAMREEVRLHIDLEADRLMQERGLDAKEARRQAYIAFGGVEKYKEQGRDVRGRRWINAMSLDLRSAVRQVRHSPCFSALVVVTLALGIGGTTAVFSILHAVLLTPLPYAQPGQLVRIYQQEPGKPGTRRPMSAPQFRMLRDQAASFGDVAARFVREDLGLDISNGGNPQRLRVLIVTSDYFRTLRADPFRGPGFAIDDETAPFDRQNSSGAARVVLSEAIWRARFNANPALIGTTIRLSAEPYEVAGIAPAGFQDPIAGAVDAWLPYDLERDTLPQNNSLAVFGRMRTGVGPEQARSELEVLSQLAKQRWPDARASSIVAVPLHEDLVAPFRNLLQLLLIAVGLVLLVACVNVANLVLVRASGRVQEFAVRVALGSGRGRLARQLMVESFVLAGLGSAAGLALAALSVHALKSLGRDVLPRMDAVDLDPAVLLFAVVLTMTTALVCGVMPALPLARSDPNRALRQQTRSATGTRRYGRLRAGLAAAQLALALALLAGAGVLSANFYQLMTVEPGFRVDRILTFSLNLPDSRYDAGRRAIFQEDLARRLAAIPAVTAAGGTSRLAATGTFNSWPVYVETGPLAGTRVQPEQPEHRTVSGDFFKALAIPLLAGRTFDDRDDASVPMRAVVSANLARTAFPGMPFEGVIGQRIRVLTRQGTREIIGVVGDVSLDVYGRQRSSVYTAHRQFASNRNWVLTQVVATEIEPDEILPAVRAVVASMDPELAVDRPASMADVFGGGARRERFALVLMSTFAAVSLTLAAIGLYGVLAYAVRQRTPEIGIRIALGATQRDIRGLVFRQAALVLVAGLVVGTSGALALGRWLSSLVFQVSPWDARILTATALLLTMTALIAAWLPARRAARVQPGTAMRDAH